MELSLAELAARLGLAVALCALIGLERESRGQVAGLRTHVVVGLGATLFTIVSAYGFAEFADRPAFDPSRIAAQIVSGIGFLGAGAILRHGLSIRGLTTAATLWVVAAVGTAVGAGAYEAAVLATAVLLAAILVLRRLRGPILRTLRTDVVVLDLRSAPAALDDVLALLARRGVRVRGMDLELEGGLQTTSLSVRVPPGADVPELLRGVAAVAGVERVAGSGLGPAPVE